MQITFTKKTTGPERMLAEAAVEFGEGQLHGLKLVGFAIWQGDRELYATLPARAFGVGNERRYFDFLRPTESYRSPAGRESICRFRAVLVEAYRDWAASATD